MYYKLYNTIIYYILINYVILAAKQLVLAMGCFSGNVLSQILLNTGYDNHKKRLYALCCMCNLSIEIVDLYMWILICAVAVSNSPVLRNLLCSSAALPMGNCIPWDCFRLHGSPIGKETFMPALVHLDMHQLICGLKSELTWEGGSRTGRGIEYLWQCCKWYPSLMALMHSLYASWFSCFILFPLLPASLSPISLDLYAGSHSAPTMLAPFVAVLLKGLLKTICNIRSMSHCHKLVLDRIW